MLADDGLSTEIRRYLELGKKYDVFFIDRHKTIQDIIISIENICYGRNDIFE